VGDREVGEPEHHEPSSCPTADDILGTDRISSGEGWDRSRRNHPSVEPDLLTAESVKPGQHQRCPGYGVKLIRAVAQARRVERRRSLQANDPGPLRVLADLCPDTLVVRLGAMLPRPAVTGLIMNPAYRPHLGSDFNRRAAASAVEHLASTHLELAVQLLPNLAVSLGVPPADSYDRGTVGTAQRAIARMFIAAPVRIAGLLEEAGRYAGEKTRDGLVGSVRQALDMVDTEYVHRRAHDPVTTPEEAAAVTEGGVRVPPRPHR
jgi:hypothetical protein